MTEVLKIFISTCRRNAQYKYMLSLLFLCIHVYSCSTPWGSPLTELALKNSWLKQLYFHSRVGLDSEQQVDMTKAKWMKLLVLPGRKKISPQGQLCHNVAKSVEWAAVQKKTREKATKGGRFRQHFYNGFSEFDKLSFSLSIVTTRWIPRDKSTLYDVAPTVSSEKPRVSDITKIKGKKKKKKSRRESAGKHGASRRLDNWTPRYSAWLSTMGRSKHPVP